ncbi:MAG: potassium channel protein [Dehalococcoidales bacterium]|nr:potassium channel protein [Dehalococcoidales bacterium]
MNPTRRLLWGIFALAIIIIAGAIGYVIIEGWTFIDALYMTIITITTVGYAEVHPLTTAGRVFSILLIIGGVSGALYVLSVIASYIIEGQLGITLGRRRMETNIAKLKEHFILCGYGNVGQEIARIFADEKIPFVVIDKDQEVFTAADKDGILHVLGDATNDEVLKEAGIERARGLVAAFGSDTNSVYVTLSARGLRPDLFIEARASAPDAEIKLKKAGADRIISPYSIGARRMAELALRPGIVDFIDTVVSGRGREFEIENITVRADSALVGLTVEETRNLSKAAILAINKSNGRLLANPSVEVIIESGDRLITLGTKKQLTTLEEICERCQTNE